MDRNVGAVGLPLRDGCCATRASTQVPDPPAASKPQWGGGAKLAAGASRSMIETLILWAALAIPGYPLARRWFPGVMDWGLPGLVAAAYLGTFVLLTPVSLLGYGLGLPIETMAVAIALSILGGLAVIVRLRLWDGLGAMMLAALTAELAVVLGDAYLGAKMGAILGADAELHVARIRHLVDRGFSNQDPYLLDPHLTRVYCFNLYHAILAGMGRLLGIDPLEVWRHTLPWAKVVIASGVYTLGFALSRRRWVGWAAAMAMIGNVGPIEYLLYPNKICPGWLLPMSFAFAFQATQRRPGAIWGLVVVVGVLSQTHALYGLFAVLALGPYFVGRGAMAWRGRHGSLLRELACLGALTVALPIPVYGQLADRGPDSIAETEPVSSQPAAPAEPKPSRPPTPQDMVLWSAAALVAGVGVRRCATRRAAIFATAVITTVLAWQYVPPLRALLAAVFGGRQWVVGRMGMMVTTTVFAASPLVLAAMGVDRWLRLRWVHAAVGAAMLWGGVWMRGNPRFRTWSRMLRAGFDPVAVQSRLEARDVIAQHVVPHTTVLAEPSHLKKLTMLYNVHGVFAKRGHTGVKSGPRRKIDVERLLKPTLDAETRTLLRDRYGIRQAVFPTKSIGPDHWIRADAVVIQEADGLLFATFPAPATDGAHSGRKP